MLGRSTVFVDIVHQLSLGSQLKKDVTALFQVHCSAQIAVLPFLQYPM